MTLRPSEEHLAARIKKIRLKRGLSVKELAEKAGVTPAYLYQIEGGQRKNPSALILHRITTALDITTDEAFKLLERPPDVKQVIRKFKAKVPPSLIEYAQRESLDPEEVEMLARIHHKGMQPKTARGWLLLHEAIKRFAK